ncbi:HalOD1 output domain-containing protein [Halopiger xanaduensis]|uniref:Halobacterial output domain-containing protein n=1 Tax=Halopiger xanaduensis (strain DSM 18323 / JCM 14033 / SH-6) TaxID=797210 RepID=F8DEF2_HALXS|nr:HalOD1 output domain-containing protein [Halopiger xanaduensis]AEH39444.1 hypothetical protein Halxa_0203 [Halopiger xanaduensis SH-6]
MSYTHIESENDDIIDHTFDSKTPPSIGVIHVICALENINPMDFPDEVGFRLHDHIDPKALDSIVAHDTAGPIEVHFDIEDYHVSVTESNRIRVVPPGSG